MKACGWLAFVALFAISCGGESKGGASQSGGAKQEIALFPFAEGEKAGYIDQTGRVAIPAKFDAALEFSDGLAAVLVGEDYGYIDKSGEIVVKPAYVMVGPFSEGMACVMIGEKW